jgi:3-(3-hydroxy-phenyl)propionate hydroxylase
LFQQGQPLRRVEIIGYGKHIGHGTMEGINSPHPYPLIIGQNVTERFLRQHLEGLGGQVEWQTEAVGLTQEPDQVEVRLRRADGSEETVRAQYVVGADGTHSKVREAIGVDFSGYPYSGQAFIQADSKIEWSLPRGSSYLWFTELGYMMVIEMPGGIVRTFISVPDTDPKKRDTTLEEVNETLNRLGGVDARLYEPVWVALFRTNHRAAPSFRKDRVFLAGDAGHEHVPIGGQGMNTGIQDAFNLGWKLAYVLQGKAKEAILDSYNRERHPVAENLLKGTDEAYTRLLKAGDAAKYAIRMFGPFVFGNQKMREGIRDIIEEVNINYRNSPLAEDHGGSDGPEAGDRALDAEVVVAKGKHPTRLRELLHGKHWTLLGMSGRGASVEDLQVLGKLLETLAAKFPDTVRSYLVLGDWQPPAFDTSVPLVFDRMGQAHIQYGVAHPCVYVIRPDQYVAFRGPLEAARGHLLEFLSKVLRGAVTL